MKVAKEVKKMIDEGWCIDCTGKLQMCIRRGECYGHSTVGDDKEDDYDEESV